MVIPLKLILQVHLIFFKKSVNLHNIIHAPAVSRNLLSVSKFCQDNSVSLHFDAYNVYLKDNLNRGSDEIVIRNVNDGLYEIKLQNHPHSAQAFSCSSVEHKTWHGRFGHTCDQTTRKLPSYHNLSSSSSSSKENFSCKSCVVSKHHRLPYNS